MKILNIGSLNIDYTYAQDHIVREGETLAATARTTNAGGKGLNQTIALARGGADAYHAGHIGAEGLFLKEKIIAAGADASRVTPVEVPTGHAIIQVDKEGKNSIVILGGANREITTSDIDGFLEDFAAGDMLLLQNEISNMEYAINAAKKKGLLVALNPSPIDEALKTSETLKKVDIFILNETEGQDLTGQTEAEKICQELRAKYGPCVIMLTLGSDGARYDDGFEVYNQDIFKVKAVDTTAAGDTFTGFFLASLSRGDKPATAIKLAAKAASIAVSRPGAGDSIPTLDEVLAGLKEE